MGDGLPTLLRQAGVPPRGIGVPVHAGAGDHAGLHGFPGGGGLATMREAMVDLGGDPAKINPLAPAELVIDHSVVADVFGVPDAFERNVELEYERNKERYQFLRWGQAAFNEFKVVPPGTGIVHQVLRLHYLYRQLGADHRRGQCRCWCERSCRGLGALGQSQLRGQDQPRREDELPGLPAARGRVCACRHDGSRPHHRALGGRRRRAAGLPARHLAHCAGDRACRRRGDCERDVHARLRRCFHRRRAMARPQRADH
jgi:hypothetical protein